MSDLPGAEHEAFWQAAAEGRLVMQRCDGCGFVRWPPGPLCTECQSPQSTWTELPPHGILQTYATYHRAFAPQFADDLPYTIGLVELDGGPRIIGRVTDGVDALAIGRAVGGSFAPLADGRPFVVWTLEP